MDGGDDGRWMTFVELAQARGISESSARKLVRRRRWRRQAGNHGVVRILVPAEALDMARDAPGTALTLTPGTDLAHVPGPVPRDKSHAINALEAAIAVLREQLERENSRADRAETRAEQAETRADQLREQLESLQTELRQAKEAGAAPERVHAAVDELHFKTGFRGWVARHLVRLRAVGAPLEPTLVIMMVIMAAAVWATDQGKVGLWIVPFVFFLPASVAALWTGFSLGTERLLQVAFRGALVGIVQAGAYLFVTKDLLDKQQELKALLGLMLMNCLFFTMLGGVSATIADSLMEPEAHWQKTAPTREFMWKALYIALITLKIPDDADRNLAISARFIQFVLVPSILIGFANAFFGISLKTLFLQFFHLGGASP